AVVHDTSRAILAQVDLLGWRIVQAVRASLGASGTSVPPGDSFGKWPLPIRHLPFDIVVRHNRRGSWRMGAAADSDAASPALTALYERALGTIPPDSIWMIWPEGYAPDSLVFRLDLVAFGQPGRLMPDKTSLMAVFSATGVAERPALQRQHLYATYPADARRMRIIGNLLLQFVVDTTGRADTQTIRVLRPTPAQVDSSEYPHYLREFIDAARSAIARDRFTPARVGRCAVRETVQLPVSYTFRDD
ncbi:MAG TPA: energy transducer TonB, partial [Candidatus Tumulicola sp.]|nr:energy transducer TonB [Candidatus Tumulicola sp.]